MSERTRRGTTRKRNPLEGGLSVSLVVESARHEEMVERARQSGRTVSAVYREDLEIARTLRRVADSDASILKSFREHYMAIKAAAANGTLGAYDLVEELRKAGQS